MTFLVLVVNWVYNSGRFNRERGVCVLDYFKLYETCLNVIQEYNPNQGQDFIDCMNKQEVILKEIANGTSTKLLMDATLETLDNLIDDGLVKANKTSTNDGPIYIFSGLTTIGHQYLLSLKNDTFLNKLKNELKEQGVPTTPSNITKFIARLFL